MNRCHVVGRSRGVHCLLARLSAARCTTSVCLGKLVELWDLRDLVTSSRVTFRVTFRVLFEILHRDQISRIAQAGPIHGRLIVASFDLPENFVRSAHERKPSYVVAYASGQIVSASISTIFKSVVDYFRNLFIVNPVQAK